MTLGAGTAVGSHHESADASVSGSGGERVGLRAAHLVADAPAVDVYVDGRQIVSELSYRSVTGYRSVPAGEHTVTVTPAGEETATIVEETVSLTADPRRYALAVAGQSTGDRPTPLVLPDATSAHDPSTTTVRVIHALPDAPPVTVSAGDATLFEEVAFGAATEYAEMPAGDYTVSVAPAAGGAPVASFEASLDGCSVYTVFATGSLDPADSSSGVAAPFDAVTTLDDGGIANDFGATLSGAMEMPPVDTDAAGRAVFDRRGDEMRFEVAATGLENVTAGHIHAGGSSENGPVVVPLFSFASSVDGPESEAPAPEGTLANASFTAEDFTGPLAGGNMEDLVATIESGQAYVNVHTVDNPSGEIRGNLAPQPPAGSGTGDG